MAAKDIDLPVRKSRGSARRPDISLPIFNDDFKDKDSCFADAYADGMELLSAAVEVAVRGERGRPARLAAGLGAGLDLLASNPPLAHLLLVEALAPARPARLEHERSLARLAQALRPAPSEPPGGEAASAETARLLAGGLASHLAGRVLVGEAERLRESYELLLSYLLAPSLPAMSRGVAERHAAHG